MAISAAWYGGAFAGQFGTTAARRVDWVSDTIKCSLHGSGYTPNADAHTYWSDVSSSELGTAGGYTAGGKTLTTKSVATAFGAAGPGDNQVQLKAANVEWVSATFVAYYAIIWKDTGTASTSPLLGYVNFDGAISVSSGTFTIQWHADGVLKVTA
jgi:hypothetical protein